MTRRRPSLAKGLLAGLAAGVAATLVMDQFLNLVSKTEEVYEKQRKLGEGESSWEIAHEQIAEHQKSDNAENSTEKLARRLAEATGTNLPRSQRKTAGQMVHYTFGTLMGLVYSATAEWLPEVTTGGGTAFGILLFLAADEVAVPAFKLGPPPTQDSAGNQFEHGAAHAVYGATLELSRNLVRRLL